MEEIEDLWRLIRRTYALDRRIYIFGNGGLCATAAHLAIDLSKGAVCRGSVLYEDKHHELKDLIQYPSRARCSHRLLLRYLHLPE